MDKTNPQSTNLSCIKDKKYMVLLVNKQNVVMVGNNSGSGETATGYFMITLTIRSGLLQNIS